jgi:hypothetical protein
MARCLSADCSNVVQLARGFVVAKQPQLRVAATTAPVLTPAWATRIVAELLNVDCWPLDKQLYNFGLAQDRLCGVRARRNAPAFGLCHWGAPVQERWRGLRGRGILGLDRLKHPSPALPKRSSSPTKASTSVAADLWALLRAWRSSNVRGLARLGQQPEGAGLAANKMLEHVGGCAIIAGGKRLDQFPIFRRNANRHDGIAHGETSSWVGEKTRMLSNVLISAYLRDLRGA